MSDPTPDVATRALLRERRASLDQLTRAGVLFESHGASLRCTACAHRCSLQNDRHGSCGVRFRRGDSLRVPHGYVARRHVRAVETNTIFHVKPGAAALTFGMFGCDLRCPYCHNWRLSQALREPDTDISPHRIGAEELVGEALAAGARVICAAYNEPMLAAEWVYEIFTAARRQGLVTALISDGHTTSEALAYLRPVADVYRVDLKAPDEARYRALGGRLQPVLDAIVEAKRLGYWVEIVTLIVPGFNDDRRELRRLADRLAAIDPLLPWHLNAFQPRYRLGDRAAASSAALLALAGMAYTRGLSFVYAGNVASSTFGTTHCHACRAVLVERRDFACTRNMLAGNTCQTCGATQPGIW